MARDFRILPANAGAGKTYYLTEKLAEWISKGEVRPEKVLAVTYTESAARELRERIRTRLLRNGMVEETLLLDTAYVSTIHGLGHRLLSEHAFAAGGSPAPRALEEGEADFLIRRAIARTDAFAELYSDLSRFGFRHSWDGESAEDQLRAMARRTIDQLRALGEAGLRSDMADDSAAELERTFGPVDDDGEPLENRLHESVLDMLDRFPDSIADSSGSSDTAKRAFRANHRALRRAADRDNLARDWRLWKELRDLRQSKRGSPTPMGYDELAVEVMSAADGIARHPGPLRDASLLLRTLIAGAQEIIEHYADDKRRMGAVDFADMVSGAESLLRGNPEILQAVLGEVDCVVIDEFQDTNPVQFALLWRLARDAPRAILVGDAKQSIMGFQGADVRLTEALVGRRGDAVEHLPKNWRSGPDLVRFFNAVSSQLFPDAYRPVEAARGREDIPFLEVLKCPNRRSAKADEARPQHNVAKRVAGMLKDGEPVADPDTREIRSVRASDIGILCTTHAQMANYSVALRALGIPTRMQSGGWFDSPAAQLARHAVAFAADPSDAYAALGFLALGPEAMPVETAARKLVARELCDAPALAPLAALAPLSRELRADAFVARVLEAAGLEEWCLSRPDMARMRADLLRMHHEARAFAEVEADLLEAAGFYGASPQAFLGWLRDRKDRQGADLRPAPGAEGGEGVELATWFAAKGREWPIVFVCQLDGKFASRAGQLSAGFADFSDLDDVLASARLEYFPALDVAEKTELFRERARPEDERDARRKLYVAMTRARDRLVLEWPEAAIGKTGPGEDRSYVDLLVQEANIAVGGDEIRVGGESFAAVMTQGASGLDEEFDGESAVADDIWASFDANGDPVPSPVTPWRSSPSGQEADGTSAPAHVEVVDRVIGPGVRDLGFDSPMERGAATHLALRAFLSDPSANADIVERASGIAGDKVALLREQAVGLSGWLAEEGFDHLHLELPLQANSESGAEINAIVDCLAEGAKGFLIVDHKTGSVPDAGARFASYLPQLEAYAALARDTFPDKPVLGLAINWVDTGTVSRLAVPVSPGS